MLEADVKKTNVD